MRFSSKLGVAVVAAALLAAATACGISPTEPVRLDTGLVAGQGLNGDRPLIPPAHAPGTPTQVVRDYFAAAAGGDETAEKNAKGYFTANGAAKWVPGQQLTIVRNLRIDREGAISGGHTNVTGRYQRVGVLTDQGIVDDVGDTAQVNFTFSLVLSGEGSSDWHIDSAPQGLLLSESALQQYYRAVPIYFWDRTAQRLVPDLRYLSRTATGGGPNKIVDWLLNGPSSWLLPAVVKPPAGSGLRSAVVPNAAGELVVNLSAAAAGTGTQDELQHLTDQLRWSLRTDSVPKVELQIEQQHKAVDGSSPNLARKMDAVLPAQAERFGVASGQVVPLPVGGAQPPLILTSTVNKGVVSAAMTRNPDRAAFVRRGGDGSLSLWIQRTDNGTLPNPVRVNLERMSSMSRPAWIPGTPDRLLVAAGGRIYVVTSSGGPTDITPDGVSGVTALSVAPDGRRIAFVAQGRAYLSALGVTGAVVSVGQQRRPLVPGQLEATSIAWTTEDAVLVAGALNGKAAMWRASVGGGVALDQSPNELPLTDVVAFPQSPSRPTQSVEAMVSTATVAFNLYGTSLSAVANVLWPFYAL